MEKIAPLSSGFMLMSIVGFLISVIKIYPLSKPWGFATGLVFAIMFCSAVVSMTYGPTKELLAMDKRERVQRRKRAK